jgi:hypothetical protein
MYLQQIITKKTYFLLKAVEEKSKIRIRYPVVRIRRSGSVSKRHGSGTLALTLAKPTPVGSSVADPGCLSRIQNFSIPDPHKRI